MKWTIKSRPWISGAGPNQTWRVLTWGWMVYDPRGKPLDDRTNFYTRWEDAFKRAEEDWKSWTTT